ncbi:MAG TPA: hypothetical protein VLY04_07840 [Bryobacteraceae bacterium]|nr:hypothetical protein [Bryobacteraceae bacterium]
MLRRIVTLGSIAFLAASTLSADFSYHEKSTVTGGVMLSLLKMAGVFSKQAREPIETTVSYKGDKMVSRSETHATIIDLAAETITNVDMQKKTYSVMTFEQMKQMLEQMSAKMQKKSPDSPSMDFKVSVTPTGNTKPIAGFDAKELVVKMEMQSTDPQSGQQGTMVITTNVWIAPSVTGYGEVRDFRKRMAEKLNWSPGGNPFMARPDVAKGMAEVEKESAKLDGMPVFQTVSMGAPGQPGAASSGNTGQPQAQPQQQQQQPPPARPSLGGLLGKSIGISRNKQSSDQPQGQQGSTQQGSGNPGSLLEMQTEMSAFSSGAVDDSLFAIPAGFKKLEPDLKRMQ